MSGYEDIVRAAQPKSLRALEVLVEIMEDPDTATKDRIAAASKILSTTTASSAVNVSATPFDEKSNIEKYRILRPALEELECDLEAEGVDLVRLEEAMAEEKVQYLKRESENV